MKSSSSFRPTRLLHHASALYCNSVFPLVSRHLSTHGSPSASLAFEEIFVPSPDRGNSTWQTAVVIHGLFGTGRNWRTPIKSLGERACQIAPRGSPGWRFLLVDLRNHGRSAEISDFRGPHSIAAAGDDVIKLVEREGGVEAVIGHSMGGKVALECARRLGTRGSMEGGQKLKQVWVLDSTPGSVPPSGGDVEKVLSTLRSLPHPIPSRKWLVAHLQEFGYSRGLSEWMASNLKRVDPSSSNEEMTWLFNVDGATEMYESYKNFDYFSFLEDPPKGMSIDFVRAERSDRWHPETLLPLERLAEKSRNYGEGEKSGKVGLHLLPNAGHWLHMDNPKGLVELLAPSFANLKVNI